MYVKYEYGIDGTTNIITTCFRGLVVNRDEGVHLLSIEQGECFHYAVSEKKIHDKTKTWVVLPLALCHDKSILYAVLLSVFETDRRMMSLSFYTGLDINFGRTI